jgi:hypothetical protein
MAGEGKPALIPADSTGKNNSPPTSDRKIEMDSFFRN